MCVKLTGERLTGYGGAMKSNTGLLPILAMFVLLFPVCGTSALGVVAPNTERAVAPLVCPSGSTSEMEVKDDGHGRGGQDRTLVCIAADGSRTPVSPFRSRSLMMGGTACACWGPAALVLGAWMFRKRPTA